MRRLVCAIAFAAILASCNEAKAPEDTIVGEGIVHKGVGPECPELWHVATADGKMFWPIADTDFQVEGLRVKFAVRESGAMSTCQAGTNVQFLSLKKL
jgi:hypothetical protein